MSYKSNIQNLQISSSGVVSGASTVETTNLGATNAVVGNLSTTLDASAALEVDSTTKGFLPPRVTTAQRNAIISPSEGLVVYNTDTDNLNFYSGSTWKEATIDPTSNGLVVRTNSGASSSRTITAGSGISISNGNGVSGNPTVTVSQPVLGVTNLTNSAFYGGIYTGTALIDSASGWNPGTGRYTISSNGIYFIYFQSAAIAVSGDTSFITILKNTGTPIHYAPLQTYSNGATNIICAKLVSLSAGETVHVEYSTDIGASFLDFSGGISNNLSILRVS